MRIVITSRLHDGSKLPRFHFELLASLFPIVFAKDLVYLIDDIYLIFYI